MTEDSLSVSLSNYLNGSNSMNDDVHDDDDDDDGDWTYVFLVTTSFFA